MMTQTSLLLAATLLARPNQPLRNSAVVAGALVPDAALLGAWALSQQTRSVTAPNISEWAAAGNSALLYTAFLLLGLIILRAVPAAFRIGVFATLFALAALVHLAGDLPFHLGEAHRYMWPVSDAAQHVPPPETAFVAVDSPRWWLETALGLILCVILWRRFPDAPLRLSFAVLFAFYLAPPAYSAFVSGEAF